MSTYAIGDIQGCFSSLTRLLEHIHFHPNQDTLWFAGDLVNRGPESLQTLRFIKNLPNKQIVLGNHDLHLLAVAHGAHASWEEDTLQPILQAPDCDELVNWLRGQPLLYHDAALGYAMVHAGLAPTWDLMNALHLAKEVETVLQSNQCNDFFRHMYGNQPNHWDDALTGWNRLRCITNYLTRARFCYPDGSLELNSKKKESPIEKDLLPWFRLPHRLTTSINILFGHWAALAGETHTAQVFALDTGCVWGFCLTAMRLEDQKRFSVPCKK